MTQTASHGGKSSRRSTARGAALLIGCTVLCAPAMLFAQSATRDTALKLRPATTAFDSTDTSGLDANGDTATGAAAGNNTAKPSKLTTGSIESQEEVPGGINERARRLTGQEDNLAAEDLGRMNLRETTEDGLGARQDLTRNDAQGVRLGTFTLRPSITQSIGTESTRSGGSKDNRTFLQTGIKGTLSSDWSRHALTVTGDGVWQRNISGNAETEPSANIDALLRLDLADSTIMNITGGYSFSREDADDPNAISDAKTQAGVHTFNTGVELKRDMGVIRGAIGAELERRVYSDVELTDGSELSLRDRDRWNGDLRGRVGYELSPSLIPFVEASVGRSRYDLRTDTLGYARSYWTYAGKVGVEVDLGEKLRGELGVGYETSRFDDDRLKSLDGALVEGNVAWSPQRGTDVTIGLTTTVEPSTAAGQSGYMAYGINAGIAHEVRDNVVARLTGAATLRDYPSGGSQNETVYLVGTGLTWGLNRYLDLTGDISYERTVRESGSDTDVLRAGVGLTVKK
ncbi:outer membrane beta-barrel protein [Rhizobium sp. LjRoot30]|uniref:outer membrane beta-barrel protein n=1 Tax=Rhizobium sp. LjRoot30 TaxID=3342320 RepID=UPI003ECF26F3